MTALRNVLQPPVEPAARSGRSRMSDWMRTDLFSRYHKCARDRATLRAGSGGTAMLARAVGKDHSRPWNKGLLIGQKKPLQPKLVWSIRVRLEIASLWRALALFNLAIDSKLRLRLGQTSFGRGLLRSKGGDRATIIQKDADHQSSSRSRSRRGTRLKPGYQRLGRLALDISSQVDFMHGLAPYGLDRALRRSGAAFFGARRGNRISALPRLIALCSSAVRAS